MIFHTRYSPPPSPSLVCLDSSRTRQEFAQEADVNNLVEHFQRTGLFYDPTVHRVNQPMFGDFSSAPDYQQCLDKVITAQQAFDTLPSRLRDRFHNDPAHLLRFLADPDNLAEAQSLGLCRSSDEGRELKPKEEAVKPVGVNPPPATA